jgi:Cu-Zn family superoxide dismutase
MKIAAALALALAATAATPAPQRIALPAEIAYPEGIAFDPATRTAWVAGTRDGTVAKIDLATGAAAVLQTGLSGQIGDVFPGVLGLKIDSQGRLWMAGGRTRKIFVAEAATGKLLAAIGTQPEGDGLINDMVFAGGKAFFTDTLHGKLWKVDLSGALPDSAEAWLDFNGTPLVYAEGANLNGIAATPDGKTLIVGQMQKGLLFRIDVASREVTPIDLKGELLQGVDGLVLKGDTLFVVRQPFAEIVTIKLAGDLASGIVVKRTKAEGLAWPATAALDGDALLVVNSQFNKRQDDGAERPFSLSRVPLGELGAK